jgi:hypothetical protein
VAMFPDGVVVEVSLDGTVVAVSLHVRCAAVRSRTCMFVAFHDGALVWFQWSFGGGGGVFGGTVEATDVIVAVVSSPLPPWRGLAVS